MKTAPELVIFDSFIAEEYFSHYVYKHFPRAMRVLDTQDLHSLRRARQSRVLRALYDDFAPPESSPTQRSPSKSSGP